MHGWTQTQKQNSVAISTHQETCKLNEKRLRNSECFTLFDLSRSQVSNELILRVTSSNSILSPLQVFKNLCILLGTAFLLGAFDHPFFCHRSVVADSNTDGDISPKMLELPQKEVQPSMLLGKS